MALISQSVKNLKGGVSQQPDILRYSDQGAEQVNGWSSETEGLQKRPPLLFTKALDNAGTFGDKPLIHLINRDEVEQYQVVFTGSGIRVYDLKGKEYGVSGDMGYVSTANPREDLKCITVADYTFITNKKTTIRTNGAYSYDRQFRTKGDFLINIRGGQFGRTFIIIINGAERARLAMPDGSQAAHTAQTDAQYITDTLASKLSQTMGGWGIAWGSGWIHVVAPSNQEVTEIKTIDGYAGQLMNAVTHEAQTFAKLPLEAPDGYVVRISGDTSKTADNYYVRYSALDKIWKETVGWNVELGFDANSMPHALVRQANGSFALQTLPWAVRTAGDEDTNPMPSLVGGTVNDIFFYRNRLGFLSGENIVMSRTSKYFNLFPSSVANLSDDDPIDVAVSHNRISILKYAVPFSEELLLWSDQAQFVLSSNGILSSKSIELNLTTEFDVSDSARPFGIGRGVYFASPRASFTSIKRYYAVQDVSAVKDAEDVSAHVPSYIPNGVFSIHGSGTENFLAVLTSGATDRLYLYKFLYLDTEIRQQSWSYWEFGKGVKILSAHCIGSRMYLMLQNDYNIWQAWINFTKHSIDMDSEPYRTYMDDKKSIMVLPGSYDDDTNTTTLSFLDFYGMSHKWGDLYAVGLDGNVIEEKCPEDGWPNGIPKMTLNGNWEGEQLIIGRKMTFQYEFSKFLIKKTADDGSTASEDIGRLQLRRAWINYEDSGAFTVHVGNGTTTKFVYEMSGARLGANALRVGQLNIGTGQFRFPIAGNATVNSVGISSETVTPLSVIGCGWEGNYLRRSTGI